MEALKNLARRRYEKGAELVEFALVLPILLFVMVGIFDFGFMFRDYGVITNAAREGARIGVLAGYNKTDVQNRATSYMTAAGLTSPPSPTVIVPYPIDIGGGASVQGVLVATFYHHNFTLVDSFPRLINALFGPGTVKPLGSITFKAVSVMRLEAPSSS